MTLMLTVAPVFWGFAAYLCLRTFPGNKLFKGAFFISIIFTVLAVIMDYIFFGIIRDAMDELYHPTTFYGYGFVVCLPFIMVLGFGKKIESKRRSVSSSGLITAGAIGLTCLTLLILIIRLKIEL